MEPTPASTGLDLPPSPRAQERAISLVEFMNEHVFPAEAAYHAFRAASGPKGHECLLVVAELKAETRRRGLWNLCLPAQSGLSQLDCQQRRDQHRDPHQA